LGVSVNIRDDDSRRDKSRRVMKEEMKYGVSMKSQRGMIVKGVRETKVGMRVVGSCKGGDLL
jgi:hypothetical protein